MTIKIGDIVTWRSGKSITQSHMPIGIGGCTVLALGTTGAGEAAAKIRLPTIFNEEMNVLVADLEVPE